ncbi:uncharacterized protein LOC108719420 [Xenopus laevis]|uniref:Uncharacterized protein LOC108719420 n=1 Tax=Xenopus laevis TaxID=8355 RepID=A0A8J0VLN3_XENLA|nr:uncharacterized protein LOC108719420 [Xenopus laevis]
MPKCILNGCPYRTGQKLKFPDIVLHPFPKSMEMIRNWLLQTGQHAEDVESLSQRIYQGLKTSNFRMCSKHFTQDCYMQVGSRKCLKPNAVPTVFESYNVPVTTFLTVTPSATLIPSSKRKRVEDEQASTSSAIVRIVSRLATVGSQTAHVNMVNVSCMTCRNSRNCSTQTKKILSKETSTQTDDEYVAEEVAQVRKDHLYPVSFCTPSRSKTFRNLNKSFTQSSPAVIEPKYPSFDVQELSSSGENTSDSDTYQNHEENISASTFKKSPKKFIIYEEKLDALLNIVRCQHNIEPPCQAPIDDIRKIVDGSMVSVKLCCLAGHESLVWNSQPTFGNTSIGNLEIAGSVILCGATYQKMCDIFKLLNIPFISHSIFYKYQKNYVFPAIDYQWKKEKEDLRKTLFLKPMVLAGDGQFDSPGHSAKICTYTMMDIISKKIVHFDIQQLGFGNTSSGMEAEALEKSLTTLIEKEKVEVVIVATDGQPKIKSLMKTKFNKIDHQFDVWHLCKRLQEKLLEASKKRKCKDILNWISAITNHLWWSSQTCNQNVKILLDKWKSVLFHIANRHSFGSLKYYKNCQHRRLSPQGKKDARWIVANHPAHSVLAEIIHDKRFLVDLQHAEKFCQTVDLENFRSKVLRFKPKRLSFRMDSMIAQTILAVLSHNRTVQRKQALVFGEKHRKIVFPNRKKQWVAEVVDDHLFEILHDSVKMLTGQLHHDYTGQLHHDWSSTSNEMPNNSYCERA